MVKREYPIEIAATEAIKTFVCLWLSGRTTHTACDTSLFVRVGTHNVPTLGAGSRVELRMEFAKFYAYHYEPHQTPEARTASIAEARSG